MNSSLILFVKYPEPGKVKTRLAYSIGVMEATKLYKSWVENIVSELKNLSCVDLYIFFPEKKYTKEFMNWLGTDLNFCIQSGKDLGYKMNNAFKKMFNGGYKKVVLAGSDIPDLNNKTIIEAFESIDNNDVVLGKSQDGGYYLIALKESQEELFTNIKWSSEKVLNQTISKCKSLGLKYKLLNELTDIDTLRDLITWKNNSKQKYISI